MVTAAKAAITQMSSVATPLLTGVKRSSAVCVAMSGTGAICGRCCLASAAMESEYFTLKVRRERRLAAARCKIDNRSQTRLIMEKSSEISPNLHALLIPTALRQPANSGISCLPKCMKDSQLTEQQF